MCAIISSMVSHNLSESEKWAFSDKFQKEGKRLEELSEERLLRELYVVYAEDQEIFSECLVIL